MCREVSAQTSDVALFGDGVFTGVISYDGLPLSSLGLESGDRCEERPTGRPQGAEGLTGTGHGGPGPSPSLL